MRWTINPFLHPWQALALSIRRWTLREDMHASTHDGMEFDAGSIPPELERFTKGEMFPLKGLMFRVGKVCGGPIPCIIVFPVGLTRGAKLQNLRNFRDAARARKKEDQHVRQALATDRAVRSRPGGERPTAG